MTKWSRDGSNPDRETVLEEGADGLLFCFWPLKNAFAKKNQKKNQKKSCARARVYRGYVRLEPAVYVTFRLLLVVIRFAPCHTDPNDEEGLS